MSESDIDPNEFMGTLPTGLCTYMTADGPRAWFCFYSPNDPDRLLALSLRPHYSFVDGAWELHTELSVTHDRTGFAVVPEVLSVDQGVAAIDTALAAFDEHGLRTLMESGTVEEIQESTTTNLDFANKIRLIRAVAKGEA